MMKLSITRTIAMAITIAITITIRDSANAALSDAQKTEMLDLHNEARRSIPSPTAANMLKLVWDDAVAASAQAHAESCPTGHSTTEYGENLSWGWPSMTPDGAVAEWSIENEYYTFASDSCQDGEVCGHWTQLAWAETAKVGCGHATCANIFGQPTVQAYVCQVR